MLVELTVYEGMISNVEIYNSEDFLLPITGDKLISLLENTKIINLKTSTKYSVRSIFCNQAGCLTSTDSLTFTTLDDDKILKFETVIICPTRVDFSWKFEFGTEKLNDIVKYITFALNSLFFIYQTGALFKN